MKKFLLIAAMACESDTTNLSSGQGDDRYGFPSTLPDTDSGAVLKLEMGDRQSDSSDAGTSDQKAYTSSEVQTLCLSIDPEHPELLRHVRASAGRFRDRLGIPVAICDQGVPIVVKEHVWKSAAVGLGGKASFSQPCVFEQCNTAAYIEIAAHELELPDTIEGVLDHEIGHVLSSWGRFSKETDSAGHLPTGSGIMQKGLIPKNQAWTQADVELWCSASPCSIEKYDEPVGPSYSVSDAGTSYLPNSGKEDAWQDAQASEY